MSPERLITVVLACSLFTGCGLLGLDNPDRDNRRTLIVQPDGAPKFDLHYERDLGASDGVLRVEVDTTRWREAVLVGGRLVDAGETATITIEEPFGSTKRVVMPNYVGIPVPIDALHYPVDGDGTTPNPYYDGPALVPQYSPTDRGIWLHILVGEHASEGIAVFVEAP